MRCRAPLPTSAKPRPADPASAQRPASAKPAPEEEIAAHLDALERMTAWDLGDELSGVDWSRLEGTDLEADVSNRKQGTFDQPHSVLRGWHQSGSVSSLLGQHPYKFSRKSLLGWILLSCGLASFFCGAALLTWSLFGSRSELWTIGVPITLAGQVGLLLGVVLALDRLGQQNRQTVDRLGRLDERLDELRAAAWLSNPASQASSTDAARGMYL